MPIQGFERTRQRLVSPRSHERSETAVNEAKRVLYDDPQFRGYDHDPARTFTPLQWPYVRRGHLNVLWARPYTTLRKQRMDERELDEFALSANFHLQGTSTGSCRRAQVYGHGTQLVRPFRVVLKRVADLRRGDIVATAHISDNTTRRVLHTVGKGVEFYAKSRESRYDSTADGLGGHPSSCTHPDPYFNTRGEGPPDMGWSCIRQITVVHNNTPVKMTRLHDGTLVTPLHVCRVGVQPYVEQLGSLPTELQSACRRSQAQKDYPLDESSELAEDESSIFSWVPASQLPGSTTVMQPPGTFTFSFSLEDPYASLCGPFYDFAQLIPEGLCSGTTRLKQTDISHAAPAYGTNRVHHAPVRVERTATYSGNLDGLLDNLEVC